MDLGRHFLETTRSEFQRMKRLAERAMAQIPGESGFHFELDSESNSIAVLIQHLSGNMRSRWRDFLTTDGEKPDRHRDREFEPDPAKTRDELMALWEQGWKALFQSFDTLSPSDLEKTVTIRGEPHTVVEAIERQIIHGAYHVGQIVMLARHASVESGWTSLTIPKGASERAGGSYKAS